MGPWNWGANQEMQQYTEDNVAVGICPEGYPALRLTANEDLPEDAPDDAYFASGRVNTGGKVTALIPEFTLFCGKAIKVFILQK